MNRRPGPDRPRATSPVAPELTVADIVHEDETLVVVNKPAGLPVRVPVKGRPEPDLIHEVARLLGLSQRKPLVWTADELDTEASGLVVLAKRPAAADALRTEFKRNKAHRVFTAVTEGVPGQQEDRQSDGSDRKPEPFTHQSMLSPGPGGTTNSEPGGYRGLATGQQETVKPQPKRGPYPATTHLRVTETGTGRALVKLRMETDFPHQARVHLRDLGTPAAGDRVYGHPPRGRPAPPNLALHRSELGFTHPATQKKARYTCPVPDAFARMLEDPSKAKPADESWEPVAQWYAMHVGQGQSDHHRDVVIPGVLDLLGVKPEERVLDVACGQGVLSHTLAKRHARVLGIDASLSLVQAARSEATANERFETIDARTVGEALSGEPPFDAAACVLAAMNIDPFEPVCSGVGSLLKPGGRFVVVVIHPAFRVPKSSDWVWEDDGREPVQHRRVSAYLTAHPTEIVMNPGAVASGEAPVTTTTHHRPVSAYVNMLGDAGFAVERVEEWASQRTSEPGPRADAENKARREIPMFLAIRAILTERPQV
ncbi:MAG: pseudouridine synthase [Planctomycetota bacterium]